MWKRKILAFFSVMAMLPSLMSCTPVSSRPLENPAQVPPSQDTAEVRASVPYVLDVGDELSILVLNFDDLKRTITIDNSGEIFFPMVGPLKLAGQSVPKARQMLTAGLSKYILDPQVELTTTSPIRQQVHVFGEVSSAGTYTYRRPLMVLEAIAKAGWFNQLANRKRVLLVRRANDQFNVFSMDTAAFLQDGSKVQPVYLQAGDLVYVMPSVITNIERFMQRLQNIMQPFLTAEQMIVLWPQFKSALEGKTPTTGLAISTGGGTATTTTTGTSTTTSTK